MSEANNNGQKTKRPLLSRLDWFTEERCADGLPSVAFLQIILALLLFMIASLRWELWLFTSAAALVVGLAGYYKGDTLAVRVVLRVLLIALTAGIIGLGIAGTAIVFGSVPVEETGALMDVVLLLLLSFSFMLFVQAAASSLAKERRRFDLVLLRVIGIIVLVLSLVFCVFGMEYKDEYGLPLIARSFSTPEIFGMSFEIAIDNLVTRALLCFLSVCFVFMSFRISSLPKKQRHE